MKRAVDEVLAGADAGDADCRPAALASDQAADSGLAHQAFHALATDPFAVGHGQLGVDPGRAIDAPVERVDLANPLGRSRVLTRAGRRRAFDPGVKARSAHLEHAAHRLDGVLGPLRGDEPEHRHRVPPSLAKKTAAFFRISRSSISVRFSRRSRRSSSRASLLSPSARPSRARLRILHSGGRNPQTSPRS
jgi:hypothetical protein